jgi:competence protein ComEA
MTRAHSRHDAFAPSAVAAFSLFVVITATSAMIAVTQSAANTMGGARSDARVRVTPAAHAINLNTAPIAELSLLPGVGVALASRITSDRVKNGDFASVADLARVAGISSGIIEKLHEHATVAAIVRDGRGEVVEAPREEPREKLRSPASSSNTHLSIMRESLPENLSDGDA